MLRKPQKGTTFACPYIGQNIITDYNLGIGVTNYYGSTVIANRITYEASVQDLLSVTSYGIRMRNTNNSRITTNRIQAFDENGQQITPNSNYIQKLLGISVESSFQTLVKDNYLNSMGDAIRFFSCPATNYVECNDIDRSYWSITLENSDIGNQTPYGLGQDNLWDNFSALDLHNISSGTPPQRVWYVRNTAAPYTPFNYNFFEFNIQLQTMSNLYHCGYDYPYPTDHTSLLLKMATRQAPYDTYNDEWVYQADQVAFDLLREEPGYKDSSAVIQQYYDSLSNTNIAALWMVDSLMEANDFITAQSINSKIFPSFGWEGDLKYVNSLYLTAITTGADTFSSADSATLYGYSNLNPTYYTDLPYRARALVKADADDFYHTKHSKKGQETTANEIPEGIIIPNPNSGTFSLYLDKPFDEGRLALFNLNGVLVIERELEKGVTQYDFEIVDFAAGVYMLKIETAKYGSRQYKIVVTK